MDGVVVVGDGGGTGVVAGVGSSVGGFGGETVGLVWVRRWEVLLVVHGCCFGFVLAAVVCGCKL